MIINNFQKMNSGRVTSASKEMLGNEGTSNSFGMTCKCHLRSCCVSVAVHSVAFGNGEKDHL